MPPDPIDDEEIRQLERYHARHPLAFARLADAYRKAGERERALALLERGLANHPRYASAHLVRARTLRELGRSAEATRAFRTTLELDPQNLIALRALGDLARERGRFEEAARWYARLLELEPLDEEAEALLAEARRAGREAGEARGEELPAEAAQAEGDGAPEGSYEAPALEMSAEETPAEEAPAEETPAEEAPAEGTVLTVTMADLYAQQGLYEEAASVYRKLLEHRPGDPVLEEKLRAARRLAAGKGGSAPGAAPPDAGPRGEGVPGPDEASGSREAAPTAGAAEPPPGGGETSPAAATPSTEAAVGKEAARERGPKRSRMEGETIREYLEGLVEAGGSAAPREGADGDRNGEPATREDGH